MSCQPPTMSTGAVTPGTSRSWFISSQYASTSARGAPDSASQRRKNATSVPVASWSASPSGR